jgi:uncharacterized protein YjbI with pentapeptide repeats
MSKITAGKLSKILKEHERWLDTDKKEGKKADLGGATLRDANLVGADLRDAYLNDANLRKVDLSRAFLSEVLGLNIEQFSKVKTLYKAELDPELMEQVKNKYPHLLEKPEEE